MGDSLQQLLDSGSLNIPISPLNPALPHLFLPVCSGGSAHGFTAWGSPGPVARQHRAGVEPGAWLDSASAGPGQAECARQGPRAAEALTCTRSHPAAVWHTVLSPHKHAASRTRFPASSGSWHSLGSRNVIPRAALPPRPFPLHSQPHIQIAQSVKAQSDPLHPATWGTTGPLVSLLLSPALSSQPQP